MTKARIYIVEDGTTTTAPRLVRAISQSQAIKRATRPYRAVVASQDQLIEALDNGVKVENAGTADVDPADLEGKLS